MSNQNFFKKITDINPIKIYSMEAKAKIRVESMSRKDLARKYGVTTKTIYNWLVRDGLYSDKVKNKLIPAEVVARLIEKRGYWECYIE